MLSSICRFFCWYGFIIYVWTFNYIISLQMLSKYQQVQSVLERNDLVFTEKGTRITIEKMKSKEDTPVDVNFKIALTLLFIGGLFLIFFEPMLIGALLLGAAVPYFLKASKARSVQANIDGKKVIIDPDKIRIGPDIDYFDIEMRDVRGIAYKVDEVGKIFVGTINILTRINGETNFELVQIFDGDVKADTKFVGDTFVGIINERLVKEA